MDARSHLIAFSVKYAGDWSKVLDAVRHREELSEDQIKQYLSQVKSQVVTIADSDYPVAWRNAYRPPIVMYYYGNLSLCQDEMRCVAYIGSRDCSPYGARIAKEIAGALAKEGLSVVTGLARGIDAIATEAALANSEKAIAILGSGIDCPYPLSSAPLYEKLKHHGLLLSEYPGETVPSKENFPARNRLIAGLCHGLIVGEATKKSGTLITVSFALDGSKEVGCVPYPAGEESACNALIKDGGNLIENVEDVNVMIGFSPLHEETGTASEK